MAWRGNNNEISVQLNVPSRIRGRDVSGKNFSPMAIVFWTKGGIEINRSKKMLFFFTAVWSNAILSKEYTFTWKYSLLQIYLWKENYTGKSASLISPANEKKFHSLEYSNKKNQTEKRKVLYFLFNRAFLRLINPCFIFSDVGCMVKVLTFLIVRTRREDSLERVCRSVSSQWHAASYARTSEIRAEERNSRSR